MAFDSTQIKNFYLGNEDYHYGNVRNLSESIWQIEDAILDDDGNWAGEYEVYQISGDLAKVLEALDREIWIESDQAWDDFVEFMKPIWAKKKMFNGRFDSTTWENFGSSVESFGLNF